MERDGVASNGQLVIRPPPRVDWYPKWLTPHIWPWRGAAQKLLFQAQGSTLSMKLPELSGSAVFCGEVQACFSGSPEWVGVLHRALG